MMNKISLTSTTFFVLLLIISLAFFKVIAPFVIDIFLAIVLTNQFLNIFKKIKTKLHLGERVASFVTVLLTIFTIIIPIIIIGYVITNEVLQHVDMFKDKWHELRPVLNTPSVIQKMPQLPILKNTANYLAKADLNLRAKIIEKTPEVFNFIIDFLQNALSNTYEVLFHFFIILILQYYLFIDGKKALSKIQAISPLNTEDEEELISKMSKVIDGIIKSTFLMGLLEAALGGIVFFIFGVPATFFWAVLMFVAALIPILGSGVIYFPAGVMQLLLGHYISGCGILIFWLIIPHYIQNVTKPKFVGNKIGLSPSMILLTTFGGIAWLGILGFIVGPFIGAMFILIWEQFGKYYRGLRV